MKPRLTLLAILLVFTFAVVKSQNTVVYSYDENGNRISRNLVVLELKSATVNPVDSLKNEKANIKDMPKTISIYPNPSKSTIRITIKGNDGFERNTVSIYDLSGSCLNMWDKVENDYEFDISDLERGVYILRVIVGNEVFDYKIIKSE